MQSFLKGAAILTAAGLISKLLGALYRIPFFQEVGSEGMGLYQMAYPLYMTLLAISSAGIPVAVSKLVSECLVYRDLRSVRKTFRISLVFITLLSGLTALALYHNAFYLAKEILHDERAYYSIAAISPAIFFVGILSVFRGYFQGFQEMVPTAWSQIMEQSIRVTTVLVGAYLFLPKGIEYAAAAATFGAVTGAAAGVIYMVVLYLVRPYFSIVPSDFIKTTPGRRLSSVKILYRLIILALPISIGGLIMPVMQTLDALTVPARLQLAGYSVSKAAQLYGQLTGGAVTLINLPTVITISVAMSLVPSISIAYEQRNLYAVHKQVNSAVGIAVAVCLPAAVGLTLLAAPVCGLLFDCPEAGYPLIYMTPAALLLGVHQISSGVLQGIGKTFLPVINLIIGALIKYLTNYYLTAVPEIGIIGASLGTVFGFLISSSLNLMCIMRYTKWVPDFTSILIKPGIAATIMAIGVYFSYAQIKIMAGSSIATVISILIGAVLYFLMLAKLGLFNVSGYKGKFFFGR